MAQLGQVNYSFQPDSPEIHDQNVIIEDNKNKSKAKFDAFQFTESLYQKIEKQILSSISERLVIKLDSVISQAIQKSLSSDNKNNDNNKTGNFESKLEESNKITKNNAKIQGRFSITKIPSTNNNSNVQARDLNKLEAGGSTRVQTASGSSGYSGSRSNTPKGLKKLDEKNRPPTNQLNSKFAQSTVSLNKFTVSKVNLNKSTKDLPKIALPESSTDISSHLESRDSIVALEKNKYIKKRSRQLGKFLSDGNSQSPEETEQEYIEARRRRNLGKRISISTAQKINPIAEIPKIAIPESTSTELSSQVESRDSIVALEKNNYIRKRRRQLSKFLSSGSVLHNNYATINNDTNSPFIRGHEGTEKEYIENRRKRNLGKRISIISAQNQMFNQQFSRKTTDILGHHPSNALTITSQHIDHFNRPMLLGVPENGIVNSTENSSQYQTLGRKQMKCYRSELQLQNKVKENREKIIKQKEKIKEQERKSSDNSDQIEKAIYDTTFTYTPLGQKPDKNRSLSYSIGKSLYNLFGVNLFPKTSKKFSEIDYAIKIKKKVKNYHPTKELMEFYTKAELKTWYKGFLEEVGLEGTLCKKEFIKLYQGLVPRGDHKKFAGYMFDMIDVEDIGKIEFNDFIAMLTLTSRPGTEIQKIERAFFIFDKDDDGYICENDLTHLLLATYGMNDLIDHELDHLETEDCEITMKTKAENKAKELINQYDRTGDRRMDIHEFIGACNRDPGILKILKVFGEMVH